MACITLNSFCSQNCLMSAVSKGFVDIVYGLNQCPFLDINHQDNDGNTALMIAAQAGKLLINTLSWSWSLKKVKQNLRHKLKYIIFPK